ncbi:MAG TPA: R3H domain-containing nucleic acid-binding protein, partial [Candidatus Limnocylindrales bacterium]|nr:R3H domain-containing nucleic acid-binding protein [Candidatus Limnocylindrales bacterium]
DEIGTELEAVAARTIAERGVQLIGTAHGNTLDNLMLNPTLSDLIGGIQSVTLGDEEARRRRTQKSVLERKAPPTFDVVIEIQDREKVLVHADVADTVDALLRGDPIAPELRWRDEGGVHRSQARPRPSPREQLGADRFAGLVGVGTGWRTEPGWRGEGSYRGSAGGPGSERLPTRPGFRPGASGSWRPGRAGNGRAGNGGSSAASPGDTPRPGGEATAEAPFVAGEIADRGPLERGTAPEPEPRAREVRELSRHREWRESATRAIDALRADEGTGPVNAEAIEAEDAALMAQVRAAAPDDGIEEAVRMADPATLPTLRVLPQGISRRRLEQAVRGLQLPVIVAHEVDDADVVMTIRNEYKQKTPLIREAEERAMPIYVLKANTVPQMESSLTSIFALEIDPRDAALREAEEAIGAVLQRSEPVELAPQNAYIRRLQHQMAERANLVSRSRGREPYRRVRLYPDPARSAWH